MKINEIIRKKRLEKGYTQEQIASFLGVSPPAVNKWEKASSYPDITLLPPLARTLIPYFPFRRSPQRKKSNIL